MASCSPGSIARAVQALAEGAVEDIEDQRGFARAGYARHRDQQAQRQAHGDILQVVAACAVDGDGFLARSATLRRDGDRPAPCQVIAGERAGLAR